MNCTTFNITNQTNNFIMNCNNTWFKIKTIVVSRHYHLKISIAIQLTLVIKL